MTDPEIETKGLAPDLAARYACPRGQVSCRDLVAPPSEMPDPGVSTFLEGWRDWDVRDTS
jgi:hypothetical protein